jgi:Mor family transcriptional regulator
MSDAHNQADFEFADQDFDQLLENLPDATTDQTVAMARYKDHLWALVKITERRLNKSGITGDAAYQLSCHLIAEIAHYQGGRCNYLPRGDKLKQELRNIHMFKLWHVKSWPIEKINQLYCPELNQIQVYKILREARQAHLAKIQPTLPGVK